MGYMWLHEWQLGAWREAQWERLENDAETEGAEWLTVADPKTLDWENAHEFRYQGSFYDVMQVRLQADGSWEIQCKRDTHEEQLASDFAKWLGDSHAGRSLPTASTLKSLVVVYLAQQVEVDAGLAEASRKMIVPADWSGINAPATPPAERPPARG
jgi:hypothetical protein